MVKVQRKTEGALKIRLFQRKLPRAQPGRGLPQRASAGTTFGRRSELTMGSYTERIGQYAAALEMCRYSTTKRRLLDSLVLREGLDRGIEAFLSRHGMLFSGFDEASARLATSAAAVPDLRAIPVDSPDYPTRLKAIASPPAYLFAVGDVSVLNRRCIAVVGTRNATPQGLAVAAKIATGLAKHGVVVVSGLARGIDGAAHRAALVMGPGNTAAVLGTPVDKVYPAEHRSLQDEIARTGALVSQFPVGLPVSKFNFPERNRVMSGLCEATIVVEAGDTSGAVIQARQCTSQGRSLFLTDIVRKNADLKWPSTYLERGARIANSAEDILRQLDVS